MVREMSAFLDDVCLISLGHDLNPMPDATEDPGTGVDVAKALADYPGICPVILHSSNHDYVWSMFNELRFSGWEPERTGPAGEDWIETFWLPAARKAVAVGRECPAYHSRPDDYTDRMARARLSLDGLSVGDAFGECFFTEESITEQRLRARSEPPIPWMITDDSIMAISVVDILDRFGEIRRDFLGKAFAERYAKDPYRGYGGLAHSILRQLGEGVSWKRAAASAFDGSGSMGNGGAMRVAPLGAYFSDDIEKLREQAIRSAEVTHGHPEGQAGAVAIAAAAAWAWNHRDRAVEDTGRELLEFCADVTPDGATRRGILRAAELQRELSVATAAKALGNGSGVVSEDTVPFALWCAARHLGDYREAIWGTVSGLGDRDTTCAIVGGIVALSSEERSIPEEWVDARENLAEWID